MRAIIAILVVICFAGTALSQSRDSSDRMMGIDMSRDRAQSRIDRVREDKREADKSRAESKTDNSDHHKASSDGRTK
jgi:hypothetical protein